jgi:hypothetical protein
MPRTDSGAPARMREPSVTDVMNERTVKRPIGRVAAGAVPGSMHAQALSGTRYAGFIQKPSNSRSITSICDRCLTQYVP